MVRWLAPAFVQGVLDASPEALKAQAERAREDSKRPGSRRSDVGGRTNLGLRVGEARRERTPWVLAPPRRC